MGQVIVVGCCDGRLVGPLSRLLWKRWLGLRWRKKVYCILNPGGAGRLLMDDYREADLKSIRKIRDPQGNFELVVIGHEDCLGDPCPNQDPASQREYYVDVLCRTVDVLMEELRADRRQIRTFYFYQVPRFFGIRWLGTRWTYDELAPMVEVEI